MFRLLLLSVVTSPLRFELSSKSTATAASMSLKAADFEVFGRVQGVFFRKFTKQEADKLGVRGWCKNTADGTVQGHMEGTADTLESMMLWLKSTGSPSSQIDRVDFKNFKDITEYSCDNFSIRRDSD